MFRSVLCRVWVLELLLSESFPATPSSSSPSSLSRPRTSIRRWIITTSVRKRSSDPLAASQPASQPARCGTLWHHRHSAVTVGVGQRAPAPSPGSPSALTAGHSSPPPETPLSSSTQKALLAPSGFWQNGLFYLHRSLNLYQFQAIGSPRCADFVLNYWAGMRAALAPHLVHWAAIFSVHSSHHSSPAPTQHQR